MDFLRYVYKEYDRIVIFTDNAEDGAGHTRRPISDAHFSARRPDKHTAVTCLRVLKDALVTVAWER